MPRIPKTARPATRAASHAGKEKGDTSYNARRRYHRSATRNLEKAEESTGATAARYKYLAKQDLQKALATYDQKTKQDYSKDIKNLASQLGVDLDKERRRLGAMKPRRAEHYRKIAVEKSGERLESALGDDATRRQLIADRLFSTEVGHRVIGGTVDIWRDKAVYLDEATGKMKVDREKMFQALFDYYKVDNTADLLKKLEGDLGETLYSTDESDDIYEAVKLQIQNKVADNTLVA